MSAFSDPPWEPPGAGTELEHLLKRRTRHADLLREAVDGRVGEDLPEDWRPDAGEDDR